MPAITILELAAHRLGRDPDEGPWTGKDLADVGLEILGGCQGCGASIAAYNAHPSKTGYWRCGVCIGDLGYESVVEADEALEDEKGDS